MEKPKARIENWRVLDFGLGEFLVGTVTEHAGRPELVGHECRTSAIVSLDTQEGVAETRNTIYTLGAKALEN